MVLVWTSTPVRAMTLHKGFACWPIGAEAKAVFASKKVAEFEVVCGQSCFFKLLIRRIYSYWHHDLSHGVDAYCAQQSRSCYSKATIKERSFGQCRDQRDSSGRWVRQAIRDFQSSLKPCASGGELCSVCGELLD